MEHKAIFPKWGPTARTSSMDPFQALFGESEHEFWARNDRELAQERAAERRKAQQRAATLRQVQQTAQRIKREQAAEHRQMVAEMERLSAMRKQADAEIATLRTMAARAAPGSPDARWIEMEFMRLQARRVGVDV